MGTKSTAVIVGGCILLLLIFIYLLYVNEQIDKNNAAVLEKITSHKEVTLPRMSNLDKLMIESVVEEYYKKREMNKSHYTKIWSSLKTGIVRGGLGSAIMGNDAPTVLATSAVYGALSGIFKAYDLSTDNTKTFVNKYKQT
jgi:hypothetical protein